MTPRPTELQATEPAESHPIIGRCSDCGAAVTAADCTRYTHADGRPRLACGRCTEEHQRPHVWPELGGES